MRILVSVTTAALALAAATPVLAADRPLETKRVYLSLPKGAATAPLVERGVRSALAYRGHRVGGVRVQLVVLDSGVNGRVDPQRVVANAERAAADPLTIAYIGEGNSSGTAVSMPILNRAGIVQASPVSSAVSLTATENRPTLQPTGVQTFFRPIPRDDQEAQALVNHIRNSRVTRVAIADDGQTHGGELAEYVTTSAQRAGISVTHRQTVRPGERIDVAAIRASRAQAVVLAMTPATGGIRTARTVNAAMPKALIFTGDAMTHDAVARHLHAAQPMMRLVTPSTHVHPTVAAQQNLGTTSDPFTVFSYNATATILAATHRAASRGPVTRQSVRNAIWDGSLAPGLSGIWQVQANGDGVVGVFDELRMANGRILEPGDTALRYLRICATNPIRLCRTTRTKPTNTKTTNLITRIQTTTPTTLNLTANDMEMEMLLIQTERVRNLDDMIERYMEGIRANNERSRRLNEVVGTLSGHLGDWAGDANRPVDMATGSTHDRDLLRAAGVPLQADLTKAALDTVIDRLKGEIDSLANANQMDMLRLQSATSKRNEAFDAMSTIMKKIQDSIAGIVRNM